MHERAGRVALDLGLEVARGGHDPAVDAAEHVEGLQSATLDAADADEHVLHDRKARRRLADAVPRIAGDEGEQDDGGGQEQPVDGRFSPTTASHAEQFSPAV